MKAKSVLGADGGAGFSRYREIVYGRTSLGRVLRGELTAMLFGSMAGAAGLFLRSRLLPGLFRRCGPGLIVGRNVTLRHPAKISLGRHVMLDDNCLVDAKGDANEGIEIGDRVFIGRHTLIYCKQGNIRIEDDVNISSNCTIFSSNSLTIGRGTVIAGYSYLMSGGAYDYGSPVPFAEQSGMETRGPLTIGANCWIGARATVLDAASIGERCVIGAGAVVTRPVPANSLAVGAPARVAKTI